MDLHQCAQLATREGKPAVLEGVRAQGDLRGLLLEMAVEQRFRNAGTANIEVVYSFPLPWGAVLLGVDVVLGGQRLTGTVVEKAQAEQRYEEALSQGQAAIMLERNRDGRFSLSLGNLAAGETCEVTLRYAQTLQFEQGGLRLLIPTLIAPRYGDAVIDGGLQPHQAPVTDPLAAYPFDIRLCLHGTLARARVASPSHPIAVCLEGTPEVLTVALARRGNLDRDFVLSLDRLVQDSVAVLAPDPLGTVPIVALASFCPRIPSDAAGPLALKILVDCSGSMAGDSMEAARRALQAILPQLAPEDRFSLSRFGSTVEHRSRGLWSTTPQTRLTAQQWVAALAADLGGTEMESALVSTCAIAHGGVCDLLLVTDGEIDAIDRTIAAAQGTGHRVFVVGIGSSPAEHHLRRLAESTGGACDFVAPGEAVEPAVLRMFARLRSPRLTDLTLAWPEGCAPGWVSPLGAAIFEGDTVNAFAWLGAVPTGTVRLLGAQVPGGPLLEIARAALATTTTTTTTETAPLQGIARASVPGSDRECGAEPELQPGDTLARVAAAVRIRALGAEGANTPESVELAVAYRLVTDRTNFLLIHERPAGEEATTMPELHKVAQMLPAGWGGVGSVCQPLPCPSPSVAGGSPIMDLACDLPAPGGYPKKRARQPAERDSPMTPAVLSRQSAPSEPAPARESQAKAHPGLTPLELSDWLRRTPQAQWPRTYTDLGELGLGVRVLNWLQLVIRGGATGPLTEETVVATFLHCLAQDELHASLTRAGGVRDRLQAIARRRRGLGAGSPAPEPQGAIDIDLAERILAALKGTTARAWPSAV